MLKLPLLILGLILGASPSLAQVVQTRVVSSCGAMSPFAAQPKGTNGALTVDVNGNICGGNVGAQVYSSAQTAVTNSATAAAAATNPLLSAVVSRTNYVTGFEITGSGATAGTVITATLTGTISGTMNYVISVPTGANLAINPLVVAFSPPIPGSAVNTAITLNVPSFTAGSTQAATIHGFYQ